MKKKRKMTVVLLLCVLTACLLCFGACTNAEVSFNKDGSGSCTLTIADTGQTEEDIQNQITKVIDGIALQTGEKGRVTLRSLHENENGFTAELDFKRINEIKGVGYHRFSPADFFGSQRVERNMFADFAKGKFDLKNANYNTFIYNIKADEQNGTSPMLVSDGSLLEPNDFKNSENEFYNKKNTVYSFIMCGLEGLQSVTFSFKGNILVASNHNLEVIDSHTVKATPFEVKADVLGIDEEGNPFQTKDVSCQAFAGYIILQNKANIVLPIVLGCLGLGIAVLVFVGFKSGFFSRVWHGKKMIYIRKNKILYVFMIPAFLLMLVFNYFPMAGLIVAFKNYTVDGGIFGSEWVGFHHFYILFTHPGAEFWLVFRNTIVMAALKFVFGFPSAIILALMFNALMNGIFKKVVQTISYLPYFVSWVVVSSICYTLLAADGGIINNIIASFGGTPIKFYEEPKYWWGILTATSVWKNIGWGTIIYLAAITGVNPELYEAASIDGAGRWRKIWTVTIPGIMPIITIQLILSMGNLIKDDFDQIYTMVGGANYTIRSVTEVFSSLIYRNLQGGVSGFSSATALGLIQSVISLILVIGANKVASKTDNLGLW